jgi:hypothetical protein
MPTEIPDLWGSDIDVDVVPPLAILKTQAQAIGVRTKGLLAAEVVSNDQTVNDGPQWWTHTFLLQAPPIGFHGEELLEVSHEGERYYPVSIQLPTAIAWGKLAGKQESLLCTDQSEFMTALSAALTSPPIRAALSSLLARVNEKQLQLS